MKTFFKAIKNFFRAIFGQIFSFVRKNIKTILMVLVIGTMLITGGLIIYSARKFILAIAAFIALGALCGGFAKK